MPSCLGKHVWMSWHGCFLGEINTEISGLLVKQIALQNVAGPHPSSWRPWNQTDVPHGRRHSTRRSFVATIPTLPRKLTVQMWVLPASKLSASSSTSFSAYVHMYYWFFLWRTLTHTGSQYHCMWLSTSTPLHKRKALTLMSRALENGWHQPVWRCFWGKLYVFKADVY